MKIHSHELSVKHVMVIRKTGILNLKIVKGNFAACNIILNFHPAIFFS